MFVMLENKSFSMFDFLLSLFLPLLVLSGSEEIYCILQCHNVTATSVTGRKTQKFFLLFVS